MSSGRPRGSAPQDDGVGAPRAPKIAVPTRTWVAPKRIAVSKSALIPMLRTARPLRRAISRSSAKCSAGSSSLGRDAHQPDDRQAEPVAAVDDEGVGRGRQDAGLLRLLAGVDLDQAGQPAAAALHLARQRLRRGAAGRRSRSRRNARPRPCTLLVCSGPIRCSARSGNSSRSAGNFASASCTRFSPKTRWPGGERGAHRRRRVGLADRDQGDALGARGPAARAAAAMRPRTAARLAPVR